MDQSGKYIPIVLHILNVRQLLTALEIKLLLTLGVN